MQTPPEFEVWSRYQDLAMHFNGLLIQFRIQMLGGLAALATVGSYLVGEKVAPRKQRFGVLALGSFVLAMAWAAAASLDLFYYTQLLKGSVAAIVELEKGTSLQMSTIIERWAGPQDTLLQRVFYGDAAPWFFYGIVLVMLLAISAWATFMYRKTPGRA
jgi:hypothetical protein